METGSGQGDQQITCSDCGKTFVFSVRDQQYYSERGFSAPKRCRDCRQKRKTGGPARGEVRAPAGGEPVSSSSPTAARSPAPPSEAAPPSAEPRASADGESAASSRPLHKVTCSSCGKETTVPFQPDLSRPVYCRECYAARRRGPPAQQ